MTAVAVCLEFRPEAFSPGGPFHAKTLLLALTRKKANEARFERNSQKYS